MRSLAIAAVVVALALLPVLPVAAAPSCRNCPPTVVTVNLDGTITASTAATGVTDCLAASSGSKGTCNLVISGSTYDATGGSAVTIPISAMWPCPCVAQFREHQGQWHWISAPSEPFDVAVLP